MRKIYALLTGLLTCPFMYAQPTNLSGALSFEQAVEMTFNQNEQVKANYFVEEMREKEKKAVAGLRSPQFNISAGYAYMSDDIAINLNEYKPAVGTLLGTLPIPPTITGQLIGADWKFPIQERDFGMVGASVTMPIFMGGKINVANRAAKIQIKESRQQTVQQNNALYSQLAERYFGLSLALQVVKVREQVLAGMQKHLSDAIKLEQNGMIPHVERLYAEMKVTEAEVELKKAQAEVKTIATALNNTLNNEGEIVPITSLFILSSIEDIEYFKKLAEENNPLLKQVQLKEELAKENVKAERANFMPEIAAIGGIDIYNHQLTKLAPKWVVGAGLKFNIFNGLNREFKFAAAKSQVKQVEALNNKAVSDISTLVEKLYNEMTANADQMKTLEATLAFSEEYLRIKERAFLEGTTPSSDVVDARLNLAKTKIERLQAAYIYDLSLAQLLEACGLSNNFTEYKNNPYYQPVFYSENDIK